VLLEVRDEISALQAEILISSNPSAASLRASARFISSISRNADSRFASSSSRVAPWQFTPRISSIQPIHHCPSLWITAVYWFSMAPISYSRSPGAVIHLPFGLPRPLRVLRRSNHALQLQGRPSRGGRERLRNAAFGGTWLAPVVSFPVWQAVAAGGPQLSSIR